ncbi:CA112-like protein [Mya arenaria]|uniref:CA112-like protein n=1 Tax=Mya arenaria TaxID=6604 RepID=A0ABY7GF44_MYAAR|nr:CA112-like protein [Mya arenaria]
MVTHLCVEIGKGHVNMLQLAPPAQNRGALSLSQCDSAGFQKSLKVVGYHLRVVISLLDNYVNHLSTCVPHVVRLIINICRGLHPTLDPLSISEGCKDDLKRHLVNGIEPLVNLLVTNRTFVNCVLKWKEDSVTDDSMPYTLLLVKVLDSLPKHGGHVELSTGLSVPGNRDLPLYEFICTHTKLLGQFPMDGFPQLWCNVFIPILHNHADKNMLDSAIHSACQGISGFLDKGQNTYSDLLLLHTQLNLLSKLLAHCNEKVHLPVTIETVSHLWLSWEPEMIQEAVCIQCLIKMTESAASVVVILENSVILKILELLTACTKEGHVKMKAHTCRFLQSCRKKTFEPDSKQPQVLSLLANLFHSLLTDNDPAIKYLALQAFTQFAETTPHEGLVPECLADEQALQDNVVAFLSKPSSKRKRCEETPVDDEATTAIDGLDNAVKVLEKLVQDETFTSSDSRQTYIQRLKHIHCRLNGVIEKWE